MFTLFRYGLLPVVVFCLTVLAAGVDAYSTNAVQKSTWPQTVVTVVESNDDFSETLAEFRGTPNTFPDPYGTMSYVVDGKGYTWQGRGRDIGLTVLTPGNQMQLFYNPNNPQEISTLLLLGAFEGNIILAVALAFVGFYLWFFWIRCFLGRPAPPDDFDSGDMARSFALADKPAPAIDNKPAGKSFGQGRGTFGKR
jgi:hypothetical protein